MDITSEIFKWMSNDPSNALTTVSNTMWIIAIISTIIEIAIIICFFVLCKNVGKITNKLEDIELELIQSRKQNNQ